MKSKKGIIILSTVVLACAVGFIVSPLVDWPVDKDNASGNIAKSSRFSRKTAAESLTNMEELLANDEEFKNNISAVYVVMQTRALQFASLVDMSNEVAGNIPAYASVLKDMNAAREMVNNVNDQVAAAGADLNAVLAGESRPDLTQNTINASLAYTTLQKQNKLATRFIETTDKYLETSEADDQLKLVRDQWVNYQQVTAALDGDEKAAEELAKKGNLLTGEQALAAIADFGLGDQLVVDAGANLSHGLQIENAVADFITVNSGYVLSMLQMELAQHQDVMAQHQDVMAQHQDVMNQHLDVMNQHQDVMNQRQDVMNQHLDVLSQHLEVMAQHLDVMNQHLDVMNQHQDVMNQRLEEGLNQFMELGSIADVMQAYGDVIAQRQEIIGQHIADIGLGHKPQMEIAQ